MPENCRGWYEDKEQYGPRPHRRVLVEVVPLDKRGAARAGPHDHVVLLPGGIDENSGHGGPRQVQGAVAAEHHVAASKAG
jgi:hypothetical protein